MKNHGLFGCLCLRADAGPEVGVGHVMRGLALAQAWQDRGGKSLLVTGKSAPEHVLKLVEAENVKIATVQSCPGSQSDAAETLQAAREAGADWIVLDGYHFPPCYHQLLKASNKRILLVDDLAEEAHYLCDVLLNPNAYANEALYAGRAGTSRLLLGAPYSLLRTCFTGLRRSGRGIIEHARTILVTFGGSDPLNVTQRVMNALAGFREWRLQVWVIAGPGNPHVASLRNALHSLRELHDAELLINPTQLPERMSLADLAITAAGSTCWELAYLGVPMLATVVANNQARVARELVKLGVAELFEVDEPPSAWLDKFVRLAASTELRTTMATRSQALMDGHGSRRVAEALATHPVSLRPALKSDARQLWAWASDPVTRKASFSTHAIPWEAHLHWMARVLGDTECRFFIAQSGGDDIGQIRFDREGREATISVSLGAEWRGRGLGPRVVRHGAMRMLLDGWADSILALVKPENEASARAFQLAGFEPAGTLTTRGRVVLAWRLRL